MDHNQLKEFIKEKKGYDELQATKAAYQLRLFIHSLLYTVLIGIVLAIMGWLKEFIVVFIACKLCRENCGGIHIKGYIKCFVVSLVLVLLITVLSKIIDLHWFMEVGLYLYAIIIWYKYVPQGTSQRPIRREEEKRYMRRNMLLIILITFPIRFINYEVYSILLWALVISLTAIVPISYKIFNVQHDREQGVGTMENK